VRGVLGSEKHEMNFSVFGYIKYAKKESMKKSDGRCDIEII
jgi:hypothetical protein